MKKLLAVLVLLVLCVVGIVLYEQSQTKALAALVRERADAVITGYEKVIANSITQLDKTETLNPAQLTSVHTLDTLSKQIQNEQNLSTVVSLINSMQLSIISFTASVQPTQPFADSEQVALLQLETSEDGHMNELLTAYNEAAKQWNDHEANSWVSFKGDLLGTEGSLLPYLRFDGAQEYFTTIQL